MGWWRSRSATCAPPTRSSAPPPQPAPAGPEGERPHGRQEDAVRDLGVGRAMSSASRSLRGRKRPICVPDPSDDERLGSFSDVVRAYRRKKRVDAANELKYYRDLPTLGRAIKAAALSQTPEGKRHNHQRRIPGPALESAEKHLQAKRAKLQQCDSFDAVFRIVASVGDKVHGIGPVAVYDISTRIGAYLGLEPQRVYLHAGTADGAKALGLAHRAESLSVEDLPRAFRKLLPRELEDCLCMYKHVFARITVLSRVR